MLLPADAGDTGCYCRLITISGAISGNLRVPSAVLPRRGRIAREREREECIDNQEGISIMIARREGWRKSDAGTG
jgi:hypothetical protein